MPYKSWKSLDVKEECIRRWASDLNPRTARNYVYYLIDYLKWAKKNGYWSSAHEMLEDFKSISSDERIKHAEILERYIKSLNTGVSDRRNRLYTVKSFYERLLQKKNERKQGSKILYLP